MNTKEKYNEWKKVRDGKVKICLGTRSAIFAPFNNLGIIIIDEEHESSYKQTDSPRYDAKDIAKKRGIYNKCTVVYASATPSVDLYYNFEKYNPNNLLTLTHRFNNKLPKINVVHTEDKEQVIADSLLEKIRGKIEKNEQVLLLMNKRGYTNFIRCFSCGHLYKCENCDISLNYHKHDNSLRCHFCGFHKKISRIKKCCANPELVSGNYGIQKVEEFLMQHIPNVRITRMDSDTTGRKGAYEKLLTDFKKHKSDILLGTQMISKGLDFPNITLVGVLSIDSMIAVPSFKANEKLFQLLVQTAGRAGRSEKEGEVVFQTNIASNIIDYAIEHSYEKFYNYEIKNLMENPVISPLLDTLVFKSENNLGYYSDGSLVAVNGEIIELEENQMLKIAHALDLYNSGKWSEYQQDLFTKEIKQPFKQVFREIYVKTADEKGKDNSLRYAGHQIQPHKTVAVLKNRRWVADYEEGLQKIYYKNNIIAKIYAMADWFSPSDIEAPTLEWVCFYDRKTFKPVMIDDVPDLVFTEVMRDIDLVVSVAHIGDVDPKASHSTIEMRKAIVEFNCKLFKLKNVKFSENHVLIKGERAEYSIHLGSGLVHQKAGSAINVLPVHSQHRGRVFLPFIDDDPKTAEIMAKVILFAQDEKIKDVFILEQIK